VPINSQENLNNGLGPDSLHCLQGGRFGTGMFFAIKWHYDQGKKAKEEASRLRTQAELTPSASE